MPAQSTVRCPSCPRRLLPDASSPRGPGPGTTEAKHVLISGADAPDVRAMAPDDESARDCRRRYHRPFRMEDEPDAERKQPRGQNRPEGNVPRRGDHDYEQDQGGEQRNWRQIKERPD